MQRSLGFSLIELIMVITIAAILSVFAMAKISFFTGWKEAGVSQSVAANLHAAQKLAIANRANVYVVVGAGSLRACYDAACLTPGYNIDGSIMTLATPSGSFTATTTNFFFDPSGRPSSTAVNLITYNGSTVTIEPGTGLIW